MWEAPTPSGLGNSIQGVGWTPSTSARVAFGSTDRWVRTRQTGSGALVYSVLQPHHAGSANQTIYSSDGVYLAVHNSSGGLGYRVHRATDGVFLGTLTVTVQANRVVRFAPDAQLVGAVGGDGLNRFSFFAGPKDADLLKRVDPKLEQLIDWGFWFGFIAKPLFLALNWTTDHVTHNFGWAIVVITIVLNMLLLPVRIQSTRSARKMQTVQPHFNALNVKIKELPMKDPRRAELQQQQMDLYKKHGVNPLGGCLPMVIQIPVLVALSTVLTVAIELRMAIWLWVQDLSQPETLAIRALPVLLVLVQFITQKMTPPTPGMDPTQQKLMKYMPLMFMVFLYNFSAGLTLYWTVQNLLTIAQMKLTKTGSPAAPGGVVPVKAASVAPKKKK